MNKKPRVAIAGEMHGNSGGFDDEDGDAVLQSADEDVGGAFSEPEGIDMCDPTHELLTKKEAKASQQAARIRVKNKRQADTDTRARVWASRIAGLEVMTETEVAAWSPVPQTSVVHLDMHWTHELMQFDAEPAPVIYCRLCGAWFQHGNHFRKLAMPCMKVPNAKQQCFLKLLRWGVAPQKGARLPPAALENSGVAKRRRGVSKR